MPVTTDSPVTSRIDKRKWFSKIGYEPYPFQWEFHLSTARFKSLFGGSGVGKSISAAREAETDALEPGKLVWIVGNTYELASREFQYIWDDFERTGLLKMATHTSNDARHGRMFIEFPWKSGIYAKSAENPESLLGVGVNCLVLAEGSQLRSDIYQRYLLRAVNRARGRIINNTTPKGFNWEYDSFYVPGQPTLEGRTNPKYDPKHWSTIVDVLQNPEYSKEDYDYAFKTLPKEIFEEQYLGRFTQYSGLVYKDFLNKPTSERSHVVTPYKLERGWTRVLGYDAGANHPTAILFGCIKPPRTLVIYDEIYTKGLAISEYANLIRVKLDDIQPYGIFLDPSAKQIGVDLAFNEVYVSQAENSVLPGIARVTSALRQWGLEVFTNCEHTIWEFEHYVWDEDRNKPLKKDDDCMDALRYIFSYPFPRVEVGEKPSLLSGLPQAEQFAWASLAEKQKRREESQQYVVNPFSMGEYIEYD